MNKNIGIIIGVIVVVGIGYFVLTRDKIENENFSKQAQQVQNEVVIKEESVSVQPEEVTEQEVVLLRKGSYESYSEDKIAMAATGDVVLFFHASWCPSCRMLSGNIDKNINLIPDGVTILKTNYDSETELKKKYGVTSQHTLVQVDENGNMLKKWSGGSKLENLLSQIL